MKTLPFLSILAAFCLGGAAAFGADLLPARLYYGYHEYGNAINHLPELRDRYHVMVYHLQDEPLLEVVPAHFARYGSVILYGKQKPVQFSEAQAAEVEAYVRNGGNLVLIGAAVNLFPPEVAQRLTGLAVAEGSYPLKCEVTQPKHPLFAGMENQPFEVVPISRDLAGATPLLLARERYAAAAEHRLGKGRVLTLSVSLFPPFGQHGGYGAINQAKVDPRAPRLVENLVAYLKIPSLADAIAAGLPAGPQLVAWHRPPDHEVFSGARRMVPPYPANAGERLERLAATVGGREVEYLPFYLTTQGEEGALTITVEGELAGKVRLLSLGGVESEPAGPEVFVREYPAEAPGRFRVEVGAKAETLTFFLRLESEGLAPGTRKGRLLIGRGGLQQSVPVEVRVANVALPEYRLHHLEIEHNGLGQQVRSPEGVDAAKLARALANLRDMESDHIMVWPYPPKGVRTETLDERTPITSLLVPENRARLEAGTLPDLDYSWANRYFDSAAEAGLVIYRSYRYAGAEDLVPLLGKLYDGRKITIADPEAQPLLRWDLRQRRLYLREKGYAMAYLKWGDEWGPQELEKLMGAATPLRDLGWKIVVNPSGKTVLSSPEFRRRVLNGTDLLQLGDGMEWYYQAVREMAAERKIVPPDGVMWILTSSWWWNQSTTTGFLYGYAMANAGVRGAHFHGWWREKENPYMGVYINPKTFEIRPSIGMLTFGKGIADAEYATLAYQLIRRGEKLGRDMGPMRARLAAILGGPDAILPMQPDNWFHLGVAAPRREGSPLTWEDYRRAKEALVDLADDLQRQLGPQPSALRWGERLLWNPDAPRPLVIHHTTATQAAAARFAAALKAKSAVPPEVELRLFDATRFPQPGAMNFVVMDTAEEEVRQAVTRLDPATRLRPHYPAPRSYAIFEPADNLIVLAGNGPEGVALGARLFPHFIEGTLEWATEPVPGRMPDSTTPAAFQIQTP